MALRVWAGLIFLGNGYLADYRAGNLTISTSSGNVAPGLKRIGITRYFPLAVSLGIAMMGEADWLPGFLAQLGPGIQLQVMFEFRLAARAAKEVVHPLILDHDVSLAPSKTLAAHGIFEYHCSNSLPLENVTAAACVADARNLTVGAGIQTASFDAWRDRHIRVISNADRN